MRVHLCVNDCTRRERRPLSNTQGTSRPSSTVKVTHPHDQSEMGTARADRPNADPHRSHGRPRQYDASKIVEVNEIRLSPAGLTGVLDGVAMLHGHHHVRDTSSWHPDSAWGDDNRGTDRRPSSSTMRPFRDVHARIEPEARTNQRSDQLSARRHRGFRLGIPSLRDEAIVATGHEVWRRV